MNTYPNATHYSEHFSRKELDCHCGCVAPLSVRTNLASLALNLEKLRALRGGPLTVNDAYRCPEENIRVGGVANSQHLYGRAADLDTGTMKNNAFASLAARVPAFNNGGIGQYPSQNFVHVDQRGYVARWDETNA